MIDARYNLGPNSNLVSAVLPEGIFYPEYISLEDERPPEFIAYYNTVRTKPWRECRILDVGCGEGTSSVEIGRTGAHVIGLEGRPEVVKRAEYLRDRLGFSNIEFKLGNVLDPAAWVDVDAVFVSGLIHHLQFPFELMQLIGKHSREFAYFCTHLDPGDAASRARSHFANSLVDPGVVSFAGQQLPGVKFMEGGDVREDQGLQRRHPRAGVGNQYSWWPTAESFNAGMAAGGFTRVKRITSNTHRLRHRLCFSRGPEIGEPVVTPDTYVTPALPRPKLREAAERARAADTAFLKEADIAPALLGTGVTLLMTLDHFARNGVKPGAIYHPDGADMTPIASFLKRVSMPSDIRNARQLPNDKPPYIVIAADDMNLLRQYLQVMMTLTFCKYPFTSFTLTALKTFPELYHPVTGEMLPRRDDPVMNY